MLTIGEVVTIISVVTSIVVSVASLAYWLGKKFSEFDGRFRLIEDRVDGRFRLIGDRLSRLENAFIQFNETLLAALEAKGFFTKTEALGLRGVLRALLPPSASKYYTKEVMERLAQLLEKDPEQYTMADIEEFNRIADLIEKEGFEFDKKNLVEYAWKLRYYAIAAKVVFIYPKLRQQYTP
jgi:hypothetical protein